MDKLEYLVIKNEAWFVLLYCGLIYVGIYIGLLLRSKIKVYLRVCAGIFLAVLLIGVYLLSGFLYSRELYALALINIQVGFLIFGFFIAVILGQKKKLQWASDEEMLK